LPCETEFFGESRGENQEFQTEGTAKFSFRPICKGLGGYVGVFLEKDITPKYHMSNEKQILVVFRAYRG